jgi:hypothetical protein
MIYEIRKADMENYKEYYIRKHANEDVWEVCSENFFRGSDVLILVETRKVKEFDYNGKHFKVYVKENGRDYFSKEEEYKDFGVQKVVYHRFTDEDFVNVTINE